MHVNETGDHLGRKGLKFGGGAGLVVGLFAPPLWPQPPAERLPAA